MLSAEHRRPLAAFILVALVCALVVGQAVRHATLQRLVDGGLPLGVLVPIAPDMLFTIDASGHNGLGGDLPYVGRAVVAVSRTAPPTSPVGTAIDIVAISSPTTPVARTAARSVADTSTRAASRNDAPSRRTLSATSGSPTAAPARGGTPSLSPGRTKHHAKAVASAVAKTVRGEQTASHQLKRAQHAAAKATHRLAVHHQHASQAKNKHAAEPHHQKRHHQKH
jgi:hypothetical protein